MDCNLVEIFASSQGEGPYVGSSTIFVRFAACDLRCDWCDSPATWKIPSAWRLEREAGTGCFDVEPNPTSIDRILRGLYGLGVSTHRFVSLTGGEPLLQVDAVRELSEALGPQAPRVLLESHGLAYDALSCVGEFIDVVSTDWKLQRDVHWASRSLEASQPGFHDSHERYLRTALATSEVYVKVVVTSHSEWPEIAEVCSRIAAIDASVPLILQPVTPFDKIKTAPDAAMLLPVLRRCES